ncbi:16S rRNA (guanine1207-N2)-methyltransferase [Litoreibacter ponti]|uniref:16S rRNA (Guanine1207-N2)-methyltransferase n=1 Tax=Litoreibacter ponti TaxID=1510457 RepID=A0A2T6BFP2_9RHOB|nr:class I SAM-dependent methyltransferase [Litoreibacter ponti]PTX54885.1 16S rRNA (guanine1207-N2)-methyltransferase [Litoreibacter ponti]
MIDTRFSLALSQGVIPRPDGAMAVINPGADVDLSFGDVSQIVQTFYPTCAALKARAFEPAPTLSGPATGALIFAHRAKQASFDLIARAVEAVTPGGLIAIEGAKTDGIESILKAAKKTFADVETYSKAHGKLIWFTRPDTLPDLADWHATPRTLPGGFVTTPGVFSADGIDKGSALLAQHLPPLSGRVADLGAGWGYLSRQVLTSDKVTELAMIEAEHTALENAKQNIADPRARFHWDDATTFTGAPFQAVVCNPPFHTGRAATPELGQRFIASAARLLDERGQLWMVANRNLPYEQQLQERFVKVQTVAQDNGFKIIHATRPRRDTGPRR